MTYPACGAFFRFFLFFAFFFLDGCTSDESFSFNEDLLRFSVALSLVKTSLDAPDDVDRIGRGGGAKSSALGLSREAVRKSFELLPGPSLRPISGNCNAGLVLSRS